MEELRGTPVEDKGLTEYSRLHAYSGRHPKGMNTPEVDEWLHLSKDPDDRDHGHAELIGDLRAVASDDFDIEDHIDLLLLDDDQFNEVVLDSVLDYVEWKNQEQLLTWVWGLLCNAGKVTISCRSMEAVIGKPRRLRLDTLVGGGSWDDAMQKLYSSGAPSDWFMCLHTAKSVRSCLRKAGFSGIRIREKNGHLDVTARKVT